MSGTATKSYFMQRVTGAVMIPISIWILFCLLPKLGIVMLNYSADQEGIIHKLFIGIDSITYMVIFAVCGLYHGILGMQSVIHDYIHCGVMKKIATITIYGLAIFSMIFLTIFCIDMHVKAVQYNQINKSVGNE